jgi:hypothetical protein
MGRKMEEVCRMRLIVSRSQQDIKGMLGGHKGVQFRLSCRLQLTQEEAEIVHRYSLATYTVTTRGGMPRTISSFLQGESQVVSDVMTLVRNERIIKEACDNLPVLFDVCRSFGGDEVVEYPRSDADRDLTRQLAPDADPAQM